MKQAAIVLLMSALCVAGCVSSPEAHADVEPRSYTEAMYMIADEIRGVDRHVVGGRYPQALENARVIHRHARQLLNYEPPNTGDRYADFMAYSQQIGDLVHSADRLMYMLEQRRHADSEDQLAAVTVRYNRLSANYGPTFQVGVLDRPAREFRYREGAAGEMGR